MPCVVDERRTVILADGDYPSTGMGAAILASAARVVCCDGAAVGYISRGNVPYAIVGDCDSLSEELHREYASIIHRDDDQESNDLTKAVRFCLAGGMGRIVILGATGKREDHILGNIGLMADYFRYPGLESVRMITAYGVFDVIDKDTVFESAEGQQASIFCPDPSVQITTGNLLYPLKNAHLTAWWQGSLNQSLGNTFTIGTTGTAIIFRLFAPGK